MPKLGLPWTPSPKPRERHLPRGSKRLREDSDQTVSVWSRRPPAPQHLSDLASRLRSLMTLNDPDAVRDGLREITDALDRMAAPSI